ncbi:2-C-methyl-D-erythritol 4-phosphate cytidylyltransferase [Thalassotalea sp. M1531]|uniref:2-C-methyl-D-erythritol 4-phosphate cytidylyltransferase n=1 Tax=Thalassotalea algicola TaxID=2716224 RepID=A0A7Y0L8K3_9GAMM|nr:2-C-methyl-D-erythritol 4-phosphate cytidylyltransferase [Thalassotalea algicola]NMP29940.1 2-C-methyl-D-erythritol 4-phosphate cytidylyltransferase [Thalassotalea algicola]
MSKELISVTAIVPAAGVGKRMKSDCPKQYLTIAGKTILEHTVHKLLACQHITEVVIAIGQRDEYFADTKLGKHPKVSVVDGGKERVDSVFSGLTACDEEQWVMVHDAARPCVQVADIESLIVQCQQSNVGGLLAAKVKDTMKRSHANGLVESTVERENLWHALTPQMYKAGELKAAIEDGLRKGVIITDESSAIEAFGLPSQLVEASSENLKITQPEDLALAEFILLKQQEKL